MSNQNMEEKIINHFKWIIEEYPNSNFANIYLKLMHPLHPPKVICKMFIEEALDSLFYNALEICGCGQPEYVQNVIRMILDAFSDISNAKAKKLSKICNIDIKCDTNYRALIDFIIYNLDYHEFLDHGTSINGAFLTKKGELCLDLLNYWNNLKEEEKEEENEKK